MFTQILANVTPAATRVAVVEDGTLAEIYVDRADEQSLVGNIYRGRVSNIAVGMQAAFVDVGLDHDVFLPLAGVAHSSAPLTEDGETMASGAPDLKISDLLRVGQEIDVQIVKEPVGAKGARGTTNLTLPGRYVVLMPVCDHVGVSRRIEDEKERERLKECVQKFKPAGVGLIVRTVAEGKDEAEFESDVTFLLRQWEEIRERSGQAPARTLVYQDSSLLHKIVRDIFSAAVDEFIIDSRWECERIGEACRFLSPALLEKVKLHPGPDPLFESWGVEKDLERALERKVWLKSGGTVVIEETEALHSIDVNTGRFLGHDNLEETAFQTNLEAAETIARQVRLRNLAGIIVIDFIDMIDESHKRKVMERLRDSFRRDRARTNILELTALGLVQMTRQRNRGTLNSRLKEPCPYCRGEGKILSADYLTGKVFREIQRVAARARSETLTVLAHPSIVRQLQGPRRHALHELESVLKKRVCVSAEGELHREQFKVHDGPLPADVNRDPTESGGD
ncbi:MAG: Rne/Rng family ribonuclease [Candidatus Riflebacteria bacterium]|nr:Rne/Rng family ribonuclease [Candidatus Riflebacteria bacterium]